MPISLNKWKPKGQMVQKEEKQDMTYVAWYVQSNCQTSIVYAHQYIQCSLINSKEVEGNVKIVNFWP